MKKEKIIEILEGAKDWNGDVPFEIAVKAISKMAENIPQQSEPKNKLISEIEGKTPEETYDFLVWLLNDYGMQFTDSRQAVIEWLRGEQG